MLAGGPALAIEMDMLFWIVAALMTLGASLAVLLPLASRRPRNDAANAHDLEVYRDQLGEIDRDAARGLIGDAEAEQARAEIARRILRLDAGGNSPAAPRFAGAGRVIGAAAVLAVPLVSWGLYVALGSPGLPSQPLAQRLAQNPAESSVEELVARAEAHLAANPSDGRGWDVLAPIYLRTGRSAEAVTAYRNAIRLEGATADRQAGLGEAIASAGGGIVTADARAAFEQALQLESGHSKALYYLAVALAQEGRTAEAVSAWRAMSESLPEGSPWRQAAGEAIAAAESRAAGDDAKPAAGPSREEMDAAAEMPAGDRTAMIENMVAGLDQRLRQNPDDPEGWSRLVRSYMVLGKPAEAKDALDRGLKALGPTTDKGKKFAEFAATLGVAATE
ncbi:c-type cytochrome biogenesis protein CcmI [Mesorhizobium sp. AaZ16]|uniref:c-type cytochrome biogenesis protein CcmI n=1 Tax=Mesorhizobium sp. AaZ16 TaxID=3402289 RepID=UPI00374ECDDE